MSHMHFLCDAKQMVRSWRYQKHAVQDCVDISLRLITRSDKAEQRELTVPPCEACEVRAFLLRARLPSTQTEGVASLR